MLNFYRQTTWLLSLILVSFWSLSVYCQTGKTGKMGLSASEKHLQYWQYKGKTIMLLGGSDEDNLFQMPDVEKQLDILQQVGGNYVRNTMSSRDEGNVWPFEKTENGLYDLNSWNKEYWNRFENFLEETSKRDIIVQIELWATFDFYRDNWEVNPYNPNNNINYDERRSKLPLKVETHPVYTENNFFRSIPEQMALAPVLWHQQQYVDKLLSYALQYDNVLYCIDNETSVTADWGRFWSKYIREKANLSGKVVNVTEMWDPHNLSHAFHLETMDHPEIYSFVDISQNNHKDGQEHWDNGLKQINRLEKTGKLRPVNNVKIYGNDGGKHQTTRNAIESFVQNVFMGCASARFHRPTSGQGLNETTQMVIKSTRELVDKMDFFNASPMNNMLSKRDTNEAYCRAKPGYDYAVYFTDGGEVELDLGELKGKAKVSWGHILKNEWGHEDTVSGEQKLTFKCPAKGHWLLLVQAK
jgi:hypothetical protein